MTLLGHTLGTPDLTLPEALELFATSGLDGAEVIWLDDYLSAIPESDDGTVVKEIKSLARQLGLSIGCLTPYITLLNSVEEEERQRDVERTIKAIEVAASLDCSRIRIYGGTLLDGEPEDIVRAKWGRLVESLGHLGSIADDHGVILCIENHFSTMTVSAADTVKLIAEVNSPGVGILYDQANLAFTHCEEHEEAIKLQAPWIRHVHVKDLEFIDPNRRLTSGSVSHVDDESKRVHYSRMIGDGILDWTAILEALSRVGYEGPYSLEYEYRWNPDDLPKPEVGFPVSTRRFREYSARAGIRTAGVGLGDTTQ